MASWSLEESEVTDIGLLRSASRACTSTVGVSSLFLFGLFGFFSHFTPPLMKLTNGMRKNQDNLDILPNHSFSPIDSPSPISDP